MEKRNKLWRRRHQWRLFKAKMELMSANQYEVLAEDGTVIQHPHWMDYAKQSWCFKYKTMRNHVAVSTAKANLIIAWIIRMKLSVYSLRLLIEKNSTRWGAIFG